MLAQIGARTQRGLSMVELMVGITIGLIITAAASFMMARQANEHRRLSLEIQIQQDLRATADLMLRDLRRAGFWAAAENQVWAPGMSLAAANPYAISAGCKAASGLNQVIYAYSKAEDGAASTTIASNEYFGFRLKDGMLSFLNGCGGGWQPLTDANTMIVQALTITPVVQTISLAAYCTKPCTDASTCPTQQVRRYDISMTGRAAFDSRIVRTIQVSSHPRNDLISGTCPA